MSENKQNKKDAITFLEGLNGVDFATDDLFEIAGQFDPGYEEWGGVSEFYLAVIIDERVDEKGNAYTYRVDGVYFLVDPAVDYDPDADTSLSDGIYRRAFCFDLDDNQLWELDFSDGAFRGAKKIDRYKSYKSLSGFILTLEMITALKSWPTLDCEFIRDEEGRVIDTK